MATPDHVRDARRSGAEGAAERSGAASSVFRGSERRTLSKIPVTEAGACAAGSTDPSLTGALAACPAMPANAKNRVPSPSKGHAEPGIAARLTPHRKINARNGYVIVFVMIYHGLFVKCSFWR